MRELSEPVAWTDERGNLCTNRNKERGLESRYHQDYEKYTIPFYSQEYVSALTQRIAELEARLATPVRMPEKYNMKMAGDKSTKSMFFGHNSAINDSAKAIRAAGFTVEGDEWA